MLVVIKVKAMKHRPPNRFAIALLLLGMTLQALWPVVEITNAAADVLAEIRAPHGHADSVAAAHGEDGPVHEHEDKPAHCGYCSTAAVNAVLVPHDATAALSVLEVVTVPPPAPASLHYVPPITLHAFARAPPAIV